MTKSLEQKVVSALTADENPPLAELLTLIADTEAGIADADAAAEIARQDFLDPIQTPDINAGRARVEAVEFTGDRLRSLLPRLRDKARAVEAEADRAQWKARCEALERERDSLADEMRATYQPAVTKIADLFARAADLDHRLSELHGSRPSGSKGFLLSTELVARNLTEFSRDEPSISRTLALPDWQDSAKLLWPPRETPTAVLIADSIAAAHADPRRHSSDWAAALAEETAARQAEEEKRIEAEAASSERERRDYERFLSRMR
jgi:hypothetical protein